MSQPDKTTWSADDEADDDADEADRPAAESVLPIGIAVMGISGVVSPRFYSPIGIVVVGELAESFRLVFITCNVYERYACVHGKYICTNAHISHFFGWRSAS